MVSQKAAKDAFNAGYDILYRVKHSRSRGRFGGWRSFRKALTKGNPPWPWEMVAAPGIYEVEWKIGDRRW